MPFGIPQLMMAFTADEQPDWAMVDARDRRSASRRCSKRRDRADIPVPTVVPGANAWQGGGRSAQTRLEEVELRNRR